jgi:hypothetical protein
MFLLLECTLHHEASYITFTHRENNLSYAGYGRYEMHPSFYYGFVAGTEFSPKKYENACHAEF